MPDAQTTKTLTIDEHQQRARRHNIATTLMGGEDDREKPLAESRTFDRPDLLSSGKWHDSAAEQYGSLYFREAQASHTGLVATLDTLEHLRSTRDPRVTEAAHAERIASEAERVVKRIEGKVKPTIERSAQEVRSLNRTLDDRLGIGADSKHGAEIRAQLARMTPEERKQVAHDAVVNGDKDVIAAVLHGPTFLVGMTAEEKRNLRDRFAQQTEPGIVQQIRDAETAGRRLEDAHFEALEFVRTHYIDRSHQPAVEQAEQTRARFDEVLRSL